MLILDLGRCRYKGLNDLSFAVDDRAGLGDHRMAAWLKHDGSVTHAGAGVNSYNRLFRMILIGQDKKAAIFPCSWRELAQVNLSCNQRVGRKHRFRQSLRFSRPDPETFGYR